MDRAVEAMAPLILRVKRSEADQAAAPAEAARVKQKRKAEVNLSVLKTSQRKSVPRTDLVPDTAANTEAGKLTVENMNPM